MEPYYLAYERRYSAVYEAGGVRWGHGGDDPGLVSALEGWVEANRLRGKRVVEFMCGEGASGEILSRLGCEYLGVDIAPSAVQRAREALARYPGARVEKRDAVGERIGGEYDAALDVMGLHMLITDADRIQYLQNARACLKPGAPMLFFRESYRADAYDGLVKSFEEWMALTGDDYTTPKLRRTLGRDGEIELLLPLVPARARTLPGYAAEMERAGFTVERVEALADNNQCPMSAAIYVRNPA